MSILQAYSDSSECTGAIKISLFIHIYIKWHTHPFNGPFSGTTQVSRYQKDKTNLDFTEARDSEWQWHQLGHMQVCTLLQTDNYTSTPPLCFLQARCPSCRPTNTKHWLYAQLYQPVKYIRGRHTRHPEEKWCRTVEEREQSDESASTATSNTCVQCPGFHERHDFSALHHDNPN